MSLSGRGLTKEGCAAVVEQVCVSIRSEHGFIQGGFPESLKAGIAIREGARKSNSR